MARIGAAAVKVVQVARTVAQVAGAGWWLMARIGAAVVKVAQVARSRLLRWLGGMK